MHVFLSFFPSVESLVVSPWSCSLSLFISFTSLFIFFDIQQNTEEKERERFFMSESKKEESSEKEKESLKHHSISRYWRGTGNNNNYCFILCRLYRRLHVQLQEHADLLTRSLQLISLPFSLYYVQLSIHSHIYLSI